ncbi:flagellar biosynthesis anti-sigma factor FlgM [Noviherbaspirillum sp. 17J57-3]|uniref:Negative regulator of flagellin synthesis n=1 Tax=Noviherbaspirillum galbum TaxID=2709383 RepID=A0A6B3SPJ9_9BURK|nr:flagellar biosynthesis anti-sigma factor FlgM [Noviherbaspirillum galbum]
MKLDPSLKKATGLGVGTSQARGSKETAKTAASTSTQAPATDSVHLSAQAQTLTQTGGTGAPFDTKKVEEIKAAIAEGRFTVDPEKVANGLLDTVSDLIQSRKK